MESVCGVGECGWSVCGVGECGWKVCVVWVSVDGKCVWCG